MIDIETFANEFKKRFKKEPQIASAPGRVNLIGEHTDYNDGFVLPFAIDRRTYVAFAPRVDGLIRAYTLTLDKSVEFKLGERGVTQDPDWTVYPRGMATVLERRGAMPLGGADLLIDSDIDFGAGLSSSAALEIALGLALSTLADTRLNHPDLAFAGQQVEHEFAGVRSGIMDQLASAVSRRGQALLIDCRSLATRHIPLHPDGHMLAACDTRVKHELASSEYNRRREECEEGVEELLDFFPAIKALRDVTPDQFAGVEDELPDPVRQRCRHVITENQRVLEMVDAMKDQDFERMGQLMYSSHESLRNDYQVSCPELDLLVDTAAGVGGVAGSRMTGGGFGGCTITLLEKTAFPEFEEKIVREYTAAFGRQPNVFAVEPCDGARVHEV